MLHFFLIYKYFFVFKKENKKNIESNSILLNKTTECIPGFPIKDIVNKPFNFINEFMAAGEVELNGYLIMIDIDEYDKYGLNKYPEDEFTVDFSEKIYFKINPQYGDTPQNRFYSYFFSNTKQGNMVNLIKDNDLLFNIGESKDGGKTFSSTANISPLTKVKILTALKNKETISLKIKVPIWLAKEAPSNFSFACALEFLSN